MKKTALLIIGFVLLWNSGFIGADYGLPYTTPYTLMFYRYLAAAVLVLLYMLLWQRFLRPSWAATWRSMVIGALAHGMWLLLARIDATRVASLFYLEPPVTMLMDWAAFGTIPQVTDFIGLAVVFTGVIITYLPHR